MPAVHRIGRRPDPWEYPDWSRANPDGTFGNRFDDPDGEYRVLYVSSARLGCFLETLARYRPDLTCRAMPCEWFAIRVMGSAEAHGQFADIGASDWISTLRRGLASLLIQLGIPDFDASVLQRSAPRRLTQNVSQFVYRRGFNGVRYLSKYGHDIENWALFEPTNLTSTHCERIRGDDTDLIEALRIFNLVVG